MTVLHFMCHSYSILHLYKKSNYCVLMQKNLLKYVGKPYSKVICQICSYYFSFASVFFFPYYGISFTSVLVSS